jgi:hypothetical protein
VKFVEYGEASCSSQGTVMAFTGGGPTQKNGSVRSVCAPSLNFEFTKFGTPAFIETPCSVL